MSATIFSLPPRIRELATKRMMEYGTQPTSDITLHDAFAWNCTPEGARFWSAINVNDHRSFYKIYGLATPFPDGVKREVLKQKIEVVLEKLSHAFLEAQIKAMKGSEEPVIKNDQCKNHYPESKFPDFKNGDKVYVKNHSGEWVPAEFIGMFSGKFAAYNYAAAGVYIYNECRYEENNIKIELVGRALYVHPGIEVKTAITKGGGTVLAFFKK